MVKHRRLNKRLDAPHVRLYRWMLDSPAYLSLTCPARAVLIEIARGHDGTNNGRLGLSIRRAYTTLLEALNRYRGKGQQKVTVEHVHVHEGGQAIVGNVKGGGMRTKSENQPHALGYAPGQTLRSENTERETVPVAGNAKR
jgi:hypothetical protein